MTFGCCINEGCLRTLRARGVTFHSLTALLYEVQKDWKRADDYFPRAILVDEKGLGGDHPEITDTLDEYAVMLHAAGRLMDAKKMEAHAKEVKDKLGPQKAAAARAAM